MGHPNSNPKQLVEELRRALHDINNALTPIMANAQLARLMVDTESGELCDILDDVVDGSVRAGARVSDLRDIAAALGEALAISVVPGEDAARGL